MKSNWIFFTAIFAAGFLRAGSLLTTSASGAGARQTGGNITINATADAGGIASSSAVTLKSGFAGQLYDATSLTISPDSTNVGEGSLVSLSAGARLDDDSALTLIVSNISWSGSGPLSFEFPSFILTTSVYTDMVASLTGAYSGVRSSVGLFVKDTNPDNYSTSPYDFAEDGIPDWWQVQYFGAGSSNAAPTADPDGDGSQNLTEYFFNTSPAGATSSPSNSITPVIVTNAGQTYFAASLYRRGVLPDTMGFAPQIISDLSTTAWSNTPVVFSTSTTNGSGMVTEIWRDTSAATNSKQRFMRVQLYTIPPD